MSQGDKDVLINRAISLFNQGQIKRSLKEAMVAKKNILMNRLSTIFLVCYMLTQRIMKLVLEAIPKRLS